MVATGLPPAEEIDAFGPDFGYQDLNEIIRLNLEYLEVQQVVHEAERRFAQKHGDDWAKKFSVHSLELVAKSFPEIRLEIIELIREIIEDPKWVAAGEKLEFPRLSIKKVAEMSGILESRLEDIRKPERIQGGVKKHGKPFLVEELVSLANVHHTTVAYLLTPPVGFINSSNEFLNFSHLDKGTGEKLSYSTWVLWLHNLVPLPGQNPVSFERILSASSWLVEDEHLSKANTKPSPASAADALIKERTGFYSCQSQLEDYSPLNESEQFDISIDEKKLATASKTFSDQVELIMTNMSVFVELRKLFRKHNLIRHGADKMILVTNTLPKIMNGFTKMYVQLRLILLKSLAAKK